MASCNDKVIFFCAVTGWYRHITATIRYKTGFKYIVFYGLEIGLKKEAYIQLL
jgi:hypothetical protein